MGNRKKVQEILDVKKRAKVSDRVFYLNRLEKLRIQVATNLKFDIHPNEELIKYLPIATVACFEAYFKSMIIEIVDEGEPYLSRIPKLNDNKITLKFDTDALTAIHKKSLSIGDIIAHSLSFNNLDDINSHITKLLDVEFIKSIKQYFNDNKNLSDFIDLNWDEIIKSVYETFSIRHILCHEFAETPSYTPTSYLNLLRNGHDFLNIVDKFIFAFLYPDHSKTWDESEALKEFELVNQNLENLIAYIVNLMRNINSDSTILTLQNVELFKNSIIKWQEYRESRAVAMGTLIDLSFHTLFYLKEKQGLTIQMIRNLQDEFAYNLKTSNFELYEV